jgi:gliding motility-associated-like protein
VAKPFETTTYTLSVVNMDGCAGESQVQVFVRRDLKVYAPNAFSPNGDGINDVFTLYSGTGVSKIRRLLVFDRWGEMIFEYYNFPLNDYAFGWDGTFNSEELNPAVFVWFAEVEMVDGTVEILEGDVMLLR